MSSGSPATTSPQDRKYQGYPYVDPPAFGVPTINPYTATRWANLPRRPIGPVRAQDQAGSSGTQSNQVESEEPVVYVDIPTTTDNSVCEARVQANQNNGRTPDESISYRSDDEPVLYIDLPEHGESDLYERRVDTPTQNPRRLNQAKSNDEEDEPVVYIDIPECSGSGVSERRPEVEDGPSTSVVQETIFYDQFKDRRIDVHPVRSRDSDNDSSSSNNSTVRRPLGNTPMRRPFEDEERQNRRPQPPTSLNLWSPGTGMANAEPSTASGPRPAYLPSYLTPQGYQQAFRNTPEDDFRLSPLPLTEFPEPPPAYTEIDFRNHSPNVGNSDTTPGSPAPQLGNGEPTPAITEQPQRTTVIINGKDVKVDYPTGSKNLSEPNPGLAWQVANESIVVSKVDKILYNLRYNIKKLTLEPRATINRIIYRKNKKK